MKKSSIYTSLFVLALASLLGCSNSDSAKTANRLSSDPVKVVSNYSADSSSLMLQWTAYKFTEKLGVSGTFDDCTLELKNDSGTIEELLSGAKLTIMTKSVNSNNEIRDPKLRVAFFKVFNTEVITARIIDADKGEGTMELTMNGISNNVDCDYSHKNDTLRLTSHIDLLQYKGKEAMDSLNIVCYDLHKGADGISKLWPDVDVTLMLPTR